MRPDITALPPDVRAWIYWFYAALGVLIGSTQVAYAAAELGQPVWLTVTLAVYAYLGAGFGLTAASNTSLAAGTRYTDDTA